ncbi:MAG: tRNA (adenosine(37)-N6)-threonylcarbamoyltransferase complex ATPase subunit type 1 TsaE [bacterium]
MSLKTSIFETEESKETIALGEKIGLACKGGEIFALFGQLGTGKTQFAKGVAKGLGIKEREVQSPTFVISQVHTKGRIPFIHIDLYRLDELSELEDLGWHDFSGMEGVILVEWAEKIIKFLDEENVIFVTISDCDDDKRAITIKYSSKFSYLFNTP